MENNLLPEKESEKLKQLTGKVAKLIYRHPTSGYTVLQLQAERLADPNMTVVGYFPHESFDGLVTFHGQWQDHSKHGRQFFAYTIDEQTDMPMEKYLVEHIQGVGPSYAQKLIRAFGEQLEEVLNKTPEKLKEVPGIGKQRYERIISSWKEQKASHEAIAFLTSKGLPFFQAVKIFKRYAHHTKAQVSQNPYRVLDEVEGIGFENIDKLAFHLGIEPQNTLRLQAGLSYVLSHATKDGHCGLPKEILLAKATKMLNVSIPILEDALLEAHGEERVCIDTVENKTCVFITELWQQEKLIAKALMSLVASPLDIPSELNRIIEETLAQENLPLSAEQQAAILQALESRVFVLTGGPGVGKTTLIKLLVQIFRKQNMEVALAAPTGRAAKRVSEATGETAKTIHRLLEYDPYTKTFGFHAGFPIPADVIILDEASMLDVPLAFAMVSAISDKGRIIFVGDVDQLAPVGPGDVLNALIKSGKIPSFSLKTIFRQAQTSQIIMNAHRVNQGLMPQVNKEVVRDFYLIRVKESEQQQKVVSIVSEQLPTRFGYCPLNDIQVLTPMNGGHLGVDTLNDVLQEKINPAQRHKDEIKHNKGTLRQGDKVIQIVNNYEKNIFNGDIGTIESIDLEQEICKVMFDARVIDYELKEIDQLKLAYAISVHKSQGSEYKAIVVVLSMTQKMMLKRNLLYTAITRAKSCAVVVSEPQALAIAVQKSEVNKRVSKLEEWLHTHENS